MPFHDVVLSSGFLAFSRHLGFVRAVDELNIPVAGVCGTSSGAIVGALWAAGVSMAEMTALFHVPRPIKKLRFSRSPWRGCFSLSPMLDQIQDLLPESLENFERPFGVGVTGPGRQHAILTRGPTIPALLASCAVPFMMESVLIDGNWYRDGGIVDRVGLIPWHAHRGTIPTLVHHVERSMGPPSPDVVNTDRVRVVQSPRSHAKLWDLGPYHQQIKESYKLTIDVLKTPNNKGSVDKKTY